MEQKRGQGMTDQRLINAKELLGVLTTEVAAKAESDAERFANIFRLLDRLPEEQVYPLQQAMDYILIGADRRDASDVELGGAGCGNQVWYRISGRKRPEPEMGAFSVEETDILLLSLLIKVQREQLWERRQLEFRHEVNTAAGAVGFRGTLYFDMNHLAFSGRRINATVRPFRDLGLHRSVARLMSMEYEKQGLILITGVSGSGKTTTLDAIIDANNRLSHGHIVMIADPIEYVHVAQKCVIRQRQIGSDVLSFHDGVIQALRQNPDIIVISEMRDGDTVSACLEAADSGHKVFTTLHTSSAAESIDRIIGETPPMEQARVRERLAKLLTCVISQKLVPGLDSRLHLAKEVMVANGAIRTAVRNGSTDEIYRVIHQSNADGMITMEQDLARLMQAKKITFNDALNNANNKKRFEDLTRFQGAVPP